MNGLIFYKEDFLWDGCFLQPSHSFIVPLIFGFYWEKRLFVVGI